MSAASPIRRWLVLCVAGIATAILLSLSYWQYSKIDTKDAQIALITARMNAPPQPLPETVSDPDAWHYRPAEATGRLRPTYLRRVYRAGPDGRPGYHVLMPLERAAGKGLWVDLGWLPERQADLGAALSVPRTALTVTGRIHPRQRSVKLIASAQPDVEANIYYRIQPEVLGRTIPLSTIENFYLIADTALDGLVATAPPVKLEHNHRSYAFQWLAMAIGLVVITAAFLKRRPSPALM